ncbi:MAG: hypothetical protein K6357_05825 [Elusimicrobiota bacterium]
MGGIFRKFFNTIIGVGFLPIIFVLIIIFYYQSVSKKNLINNYQRLCDLYAVSSYESINNFATRLDYLYYLRSVYKDDSIFLKKIIEKYEEVVFVALLNSSGKESMRYSVEGFSKLFPVIDISSEDYFARIKDSDRGVIGNFQIVKDWPIASIVYPVGKDFVYVVVNLRKFFSNVYKTRIGNTGFAFFLSEGGVVLSDIDVNIGYKEMNKITQNLYGNAEIFINGKNYFSVFRKIADLELYLVLSMQKEEFFRDINLIFYSMLFLIFLVLTVSYYIAFVTSRNLARPISALISASERVSNGVFNEPVVERSDFKEFNDLLKVFNSMMIRLGEYNNLQIDKIKDEREKLYTITNSLKDAIILIDFNGDVVYSNKQAEEIFNGDFKIIKENIGIIDNKNESLNRIINIKDKYFEIYSDIINLTRGKPLKLAVARDVTLEMNIYKVKEDLFRSIAHDLRNPLLNMQGYIKLLSYDADEKSRRYIDGLKNESEIVFRMIENILDMSRIENKKLELKISKTNIVEFAKKLAERYDIRAKSKNIFFELDIPSEPIYAAIDEELFSRAVDNILSNAFKYTDEGGRVKFQIVCSDKIYIIIDDTGKGIDPLMLKNIFDRFKTTSKDGFGLGLSIAKTIIDMHRASIKVESELSKGTKFTISLDKV